VADQPFGDLPVKLFVFDDDVIALVESAQNVGIGFQAEGA